MQTLGISNSTPRSENRLKSLFWPSIDTADDVDYLGVQGYWICAIAAVLALVILTLTGQPIAGIFASLFCYLGGVGVREHSLFAAAAVFVMFFLNTVASPGVVTVILTAVLLSNLRATWIASYWEPKSQEAALPARQGATWGDKFADKLPQWLWPKIRIVYYIYSAGLLALVMIGIVVTKLHLVK